MKEIQHVLPEFQDLVEDRQLSSASKRWMQDLGLEVEALAQMMRKPTDRRPFIYEVRIDLVPANGREPLLVAKGFGAEAGLVSFYNGSGLLTLLRGFSSQLKAGAETWTVDKYPGERYPEKLQAFLSGDYYRV